MTAGGARDDLPPASAWLLDRLGRSPSAPAPLADLRKLAGLMGTDLAGLRDWLEGQEDARSLNYTHRARIAADLAVLYAAIGSRP